MPLIPLTPRGTTAPDASPATEEPPRPAARAEEPPRPAARAEEPPRPAARAEEPGEPRLLPLRALLGEFDRDAEMLAAAREFATPRTPVTGFPGLDDALGGALSPGVHVVLGAPGVGKTAFALQVAAQCGCPAMYVTCEMPPLELLKRLIARSTGLFLGRLKSGELAPEDAAARARDAIRKHPRLVLLDATNAYPGHTAITTGADAVRRQREDEAGDAPPVSVEDARTLPLLIVLDSLHAWSDLSGVNAPEYDRLAAHLSALKRISRELNAPILVISERNRQSMTAGGLSGGAGHRGIEYGAETVLDLDTPAGGTPDAGGEMEIILHIRKNRHGAKGEPLALRFHGGLQRFRMV